MIHSPRRLIPIAVLASACGGAPAGAQAPAPEPASREHLYVYEVAPGQVAPEAQRAEPGVIRVTGSARIAVEPDRAQVSFAVETRADEAGEAAAGNATAMAEVLAAVRAGGFADLAVETFGYSLHPIYSYGTEGGTRVQRIDGYVAVNNVRATTSDVAAVGRLIDAALGGGANRIAGLTFLASDTETARREALRRAVAQARAEAEVLASALGYTLGAPVEVTGGAELPTPRPTFEVAMTLSRAAPETPIESADQFVRASVNVTFALGPARR